MGMWSRRLFRVFAAAAIVAVVGGTPWQTPRPVVVGRSHAELGVRLGSSLRRVLLQRPAAFRSLAVPPSGAPDEVEESKVTTVHGSTETPDMVKVERIVNETWDCTFPEGDCFTRSAHQEGLPTHLDNCINETNLTPLKLLMEIDLHCANMDASLKCDEKLPTNRPFDPFYLCNNDPLVMEAQCLLECRNGFPWQICTFQFDKSGQLRMDDETIEVCNLDAACRSPYLEQNQIFCSGMKTVDGHKAPWFRREIVRRHAKEDIAAVNRRRSNSAINSASAVPHPSAAGAAWGFFLATIVVAMLIVLGVRFGEGCVGRMKFWRGPRSETRHIQPYCAPEIRSAQGQYAPPQPLRKVPDDPRELEQLRKTADVERADGNEQGVGVDED